MWRYAALTFLFCVGCASNDAYVCEDGVWGDFASRLSSAPRYAPQSPTSSPAFYPDMVAVKSADGSDAAVAASGKR
jgi:hypothetical protein